MIWLRAGFGEIIIFNFFFFKKKQQHCDTVQNDLLKEKAP